MARPEVEAIAKRLAVPIPTPYKPPPAPQATWRLLKPKQHLKSKVDITLPNAHIPKGTLWTVLELDSQGALLGVVANTQFTAGPSSATMQPDSPPTFRWERPEWQKYFERARAPRKKVRTG